jgi:hypothetical protein
VGPFKFVVPPGDARFAPVLVGLVPASVAASRYGGRATGIFSDNTVRDANTGELVKDMNAPGASLPPGARYVVAWGGPNGLTMGYLVERADGMRGPWQEGDPPAMGKPLALGGGITSEAVARKPDGSPLDPVPLSAAEMKSAFPAGFTPYTSAGAPGEQPNTDPLFIAGVRPPEPVYDDSRYGGWGAPVVSTGGMGYPSSWSRRDDRWVYPDGRITDAQGTVLGVTDDPHQAARELQQRAGTPSIRWTGAQVIFSETPPSPSALITVQQPNGAILTVDGTGRVVNAAAPIGSQTMKAVPDDAGWLGTQEAAGTPAPIIRTANPIPSSVTPPSNPAGVQNGDNPGSGMGTATRPISGVAAPPIISPDAMPASGADVLAGIPKPVLWGIGGLVALLVVVRVVRG